jgi:hypothetical protein
MYGQNLIPNYSFEEYQKCPADLNVRYKKEIVPGWYMPSLGTADYFNYCTKFQVGVPQNFMGYCLPKDGLAYVGIILLHNPPDTGVSKNPSNYREYIQTNLYCELEKDKIYEISFYYFVASYSTYVVNRLGAYFSAEKIGNKRITTVLNYKPQVFIDTTAIDYETDKWFQFKGSYKAKGGEKYLTIGNFYDDRHTAFKPCDLTGVSEVKQIKIRSEKIAYYYIDMVSVTKATQP